MVEPDLFHDIVVQPTIRGAGTQPSAAARVRAALFRYLPPDGNEMQAIRAEIAEACGCRPEEVSRVMGSWKPWAPSTAGARRGLPVPFPLSHGAMAARRVRRDVRQDVHPALVPVPDDVGRP